MIGSTPPVVKNLIIINVIMLLATWVFQSMGIDLAQVLGLFFFKSQYFHPYQIITHMFMHGGITHLFFNMFALWMFGRVLESVWGSKKFLFYYFVTGLGAVVIHTLVNYLQLMPMMADASAFANTPSPDLMSLFIKHYIPKPNPQVYDFITNWSLDKQNPGYIAQAIGMINDSVQFKMNIPTIGASGAVYGVLLAFGMLFPNTQLMLLFPPIPIKAKWVVIIYGALELFLGITQPGSDVAHFAHLGGMIFGFFLIRYWNKHTTTLF
jgi:membrane associated rhomboid family serine protease